MSKALFTGSFDPITNGHMDIIVRGAKIFDEMVVGVVGNPGKNPLFTAEERVAMIREEVKNLPNVKVDSFTGLLADYVNNNGFEAVVRGLRGPVDFDYELQMAHMNSKLFIEGCETIFFMTDPRYAFISSSLVKEVASLGGDIEGLVPNRVLKEINKKYSK